MTTARKSTRKVTKTVAPVSDNIAWVEGTGKVVGATVRKGKEVVEQAPVVARSFWSGVLKGYNG